MDSGSCSASSRCDASSSSSNSTYAVAAFFTAVVLTGALLPYIWRLAGSTLGWYLRQRTESQRQYLLETMAADEKRFQEQKKQQQQQTTKKNDSSDDDWENVEAEAVASAGNGEKDWDGIVGFFHPFW
jgi:alpha-1,2-mannosyltransferase